MIVIIYNFILISISQDGKWIERSISCVVSIDGLWTVADRIGILIVHSQNYWIGLVYSRWLVVIVVLVRKVVGIETGRNLKYIWDGQLTVVQRAYRNGVF